jgi:hypothetical protein
MKISGCKIVRTKQIYMQVQIQAQRFIESEYEFSREQEQEQDRIWGKKVLFISGIVLLMSWMFVIYLDVTPIQSILTYIYNFMLSYVSLSHRVICDAISFIIGLVFIFIFSIIVITTIVASSIPFLAFIFAFTSI